MATRDENLLHSILKNNIMWELGGYENAWFDGELTCEEFNAMLTEENAMEIATYNLNEAYRKGHLESETNGIALEAKHIKFMGNERIEHIKQVACRNALKHF